MGKRGPPRLPTATRKLHGTTQRCRANLDEPAARPGVPAAPSFLDKEALLEWERLIPELQLRGLIEKIDLGVLTSYVTAWSQLAAAERALCVEGAVLIDHRGALVTSPWVKVAATARAQLIAAGRELGLSPASRTQVKSVRPLDPEAEARRRRFLGVGFRGGSGELMR